MSELDLVKSLADHYPLEDLLAENDIEEYFVVRYLVEEGLVNLADYFYEDEKEIDRDD